jgi:hypothetical protein
MRARVFISCGQTRGSDEEIVANNISKRLLDLGFDPYVAVAEQTLLGLKENIFARLRTSEYFLFVDFKRELIDPTREIHRGSLFTHQELALAAFSDIDVLAFQERGVKPDDGILSIIQANAVQFTDRHTLHNVVADKVKERCWDPNWRNELVLKRRPEQFSDADVLGNQPIKTRFFFIDAHNLHREKAATNCYVYLDKIITPQGEVIPNTIEFKWSGTRLPNVGIAPRASRSFDAFSIYHNDPTGLQFFVHSDSWEFVPRVPKGQGDYTLFYRVMCDNFPPARGSFSLSLKALLQDTTLG